MDKCFQDQESPFCAKENFINETLSLYFNIARVVFFCFFFFGGGGLSGGAFWVGIPPPPQQQKGIVACHKISLLPTRYFNLSTTKTTYFHQQTRPVETSITRTQNIGPTQTSLRVMLRPKRTITSTTSTKPALLNRQVKEASRKQSKLNDTRA